MRFWRCRFEIECIVLARLSPIAGRNKLPCLVNGIIHKELAVVRLGANYPSNRLCLLNALRQIEHAANRFERRSIEHVCRIIYILHIVIRFRPLDKYPTLQFFEETIFILERSKVVKQLEHPGSESLNYLTISAPQKILFQLNEKPKRPGRNKSAIIMIRRITHRNHSIRDIYEMPRQKEIFKETLLYLRMSAQKWRDLRSKGTIAQPSSTFPGRRVRKEVHSIGAVRLSACLE